MKQQTFWKHVYWMAPRNPPHRLPNPTTPDPYPYHPLDHHPSVTMGRINESYRIPLKYCKLTAEAWTPTQMCCSWIKLFLYPTSLGIACNKKKCKQLPIFTPNIFERRLKYILLYFAANVFNSKAINKFFLNSNSLSIFPNDQSVLSIPTPTKWCENTVVVWN